MRPSLNTTLLMMLLTVMAMIWLLRRDYAQRNQEFFPGMLESVPYDALSSNMNFPDGKTLQTPVPGTTARGYFPLHYNATTEDAILAGNKLLNPISDTLESEKERGEKIFRTFCVPCHGSGGLGDGSVTKRGFPPPPSLLAEKAVKMNGGQMFHILTYGQNNMPSLAAQVQRIDRWRVITYVRSVQKKAIAAASQTSPTIVDSKASSNN